jgi:hypothetical protein
MIPLCTLSSMYPKVPEEVLPGGGTSHRLQSSPPRKVVSHAWNQLRRPSRLRTRVLFLILIMAGVSFLLFGRQYTVSFPRQNRIASLLLNAPGQPSTHSLNLSTYIPNRITPVISQYAETEHTRWDDDIDPEPKSTSNMNIKKPKLHLLMPSKKPTPNLCRALLSATALNYTPPTLVGYGIEGANMKHGVDVVRSTYSILQGRQAHDDDLILVIEEGWSSTRPIGEWRLIKDYR